MKRRVLIMGAAGRDFHNFNLLFRDQEDYEVVAFTATQIPDIEGRRYPPELAGKLYPNGIPIHAEAELPQLIASLKVDEVVFAYSDVNYDYLMHRASLVSACGADFRLLSAASTMLTSKKPVISVCAVRTGVGKSQTTRRVCDILKGMGLKVVAVRHPMPYGNLAEQACQRFAEYADLDKHRTTIEEREEYEPHIDRGIVVYAGVDYAQILAQAEQEADVIIWDGGNNDTPFYKPDLSLVLVDPHRPGHEERYYPGETNLRMADVVVINKVDTADRASVDTVRANVRRLNPEAVIIEAASPVFVDGSEQIRGKKVLVIEDGPTLTHGEMTYGAGAIAAYKFGAAELVDPRPYAVASIAQTYAKYSHLTEILPAMGYGEQQIKDLQQTIDRTPCDMILIGTPIDLRRVMTLSKPALRVSYELQELGTPTLKEVLARFKT